MTASTSTTTRAATLERARAFWIPFVAEAYPLRTGTCRAGASIGTSSGGTHGPDGMGSLEENGFVVLGGDNRVLERGVGRGATVVVVDTPLLLTIATVADGGYYKGFMFRVEGADGQDASNTLSVVDDNDDNDSVLLPSDGDAIGPLASCAKHVTAVSHSNGRNKTRSSVEFRATQSGTYTVDVQLVMENGADTRNFWVHSAYQLLLVDPPTMSPSETPPPPSSSTPTLSPRDSSDCPDAKFCKRCNRCRKVYEKCADGQGYCTVCKNYCVDVYRGNVIFGPPETEKCSNNRMSNQCRRCPKYEKTNNKNCEGGKAYCAYCRKVFPGRYQGNEE